MPFPCAPSSCLSPALDVPLPFYKKLLLGHPEVMSHSTHLLMVSSGCKASRYAMAGPWSRTLAICAVTLMLKAVIDSTFFLSVLYKPLLPWELPSRIAQAREGLPAPQPILTVEPILVLGSESFPCHSVDKVRTILPITGCVAFKT